MVKVKGYEIKAKPVRDSFYRRATSFKNKIIATLKTIGVPEDDVDIKVETMAMKKTQASASWYFDRSNLFFSHNSGNFAENLYIVLQVIEIAVQELIDEEISVDEFVNKFEEDKDIGKSRKKAREVLGVPEDCLDIDLINKEYKKLSKKYHPDMEGGDIKKFKEINHAHKMLKRELG